MLLSLFRSEERGPTDDFWYKALSFGGRSTRVTTESALRVTAVFACVRVLAESFAVLPFELYRPRANGKGRDLVTDHWVYRLFAKRPNRWQNPCAWREMMQGHLALRGNCFNRIVDGPAGSIAELVPMHPDRIKIELLDNGSWRYRYKDQAGAEEILRRDQVWHLRGLSDDGIVGYNPIELAREAIGGAQAGQSYRNRFLDNNAQPPGWIEVPGKFESKEARQKFRDSWQENQSAKNLGKTAVLEGGLKYHQIQMTNRDAQFLEVTQASVPDIARMWRMPPHKIGDLSRSTNNNIEHQSLEFWVDTMMPWTTRWESSIVCELLGEDSGLQAEFNFTRLLRGDSAARAVYITRLTNAGVLTRNEGRDLEGYNPLPGLDEPLTPQNMSVGADHEDAAPAGKGSKPVQTPAPEDDAAAEARLTLLLQANTERLARRASAALEKHPPAQVFDSAFASLMVETLAISEQKAENYCRAMRAFGSVDEPAYFNTFFREMLYAEVLGAKP